MIYVSENTKKRLPVYLKAFKSLQEKNVTKIFSHDLAAMVNISAATIRKDLACLGSNGIRGHGYNIEDLIKILNEIFESEKYNQIALIGCGYLGQAVLRYNSDVFSQGKIVQIYDTDPEIIGQTHFDIEIMDYKKLSMFSLNHIHVAIVTTPAAVAQEVCDKLVKSGIKGIINMSGAYVQISDPTVQVQSIDFAQTLQSLIYEMKNL